MSHKLTYALAGVTAGDISALIGKGGLGIKNAKSDAWRIYTALQNTDRKVEEEKPQLRIELRNEAKAQRDERHLQLEDDHHKGDEPVTEGSDGGSPQELCVRQKQHNSTSADNVTEDQMDCLATIASASETMIKIAKQCLDDYAKSFIDKKTLMPITFVLEFPQELIGLLVTRFRGSRRGGPGLIQQVIENDKGSDSTIHSEDKAIFRGARFWVNQMNVSSVEQLELVLSRGSHFIGWAPGPNHEIKKMISIRITLPISNVRPLKNRDLFIDRLEDVIKRISDDIKRQNAKDTATIDAALDEDLAMDY